MPQAASDSIDSCIFKNALPGSIDMLPVPRRKTIPELEPVRHHRVVRMASSFVSCEPKQS
jgi:hypothetical protein